MRSVVRVIFLALLFLAGSARAALPLTLYLSSLPMPAASEAWPTMPPQPLPKGLRPCCAFGYDLHAELLGLPVPFYQLNNVVTVDSLGHHQYNDHLYSGVANLIGLSGENNGIVYTLRGGFIDTAHVRDTADMTVYIFSQLLPKLGQAFTLNLGEELAERRLVFTAFTLRSMHASVTRWPPGCRRIWRSRWRSGTKSPNGTVSSLFADFLREYRPFRRKISILTSRVPVWRRL